jgi:hypothetical protein
MSEKSATEFQAATDRQACCNYNCEQGKVCPHRRSRLEKWLDSLWFSAAVAIAVTFFIALVLSPELAQLLRSWKPGS